MRSPFAAADRPRAACPRRMLPRAWAPLVALAVAFAAVVASPVAAVEAGAWGEVWRRDLGGRVAESAVVAGDRVFLAAGSILHALDAADGRVVWSSEVGPGRASGPTLADGALFVGSEDGALVRIDAANGATVWRTTGLGALSGPPLVVDDEVYVKVRSGDFAEDLVAFDADTGGERWRVPLGQVTVFPPRALGDVVLVGDANGAGGDRSVRALDRADGREVWRTDPAAGLGLRAVGEEQIYAVASGVLVALDPTDGSVRWRYDSGLLIWAFGGPVERDGVVYGGFDVGAGRLPTAKPPRPGVVALDAATGEERWRTVAAEGARPLLVARGPIVTAEAVVAVAGVPSAPTVFDRTTGASVWRAPMTGSGQAVLLAATSTLIVAGGQDGRVVAYGPADRLDVPNATPVGRVVRAEARPDRAAPHRATPNRSFAVGAGSTGSGGEIGAAG